MLCMDDLITNTSIGLCYHLQNLVGSHATDDPRRVQPVHLAKGFAGEAGLRRVAGHCHVNAVRLAEALSGIPGVELVTEAFFNEFTLKLPVPAAEAVEALAAKGVLGGVPASRLDPNGADAAGLLIVAATETNTEADIDAYADALREVLK